MTFHHIEEVALPSLTFQSEPIVDNVIFGWGGGGGGGGGGRVSGGSYFYTFYLVVLLGKGPILYV